jgi:uncharacterized protein (DUF1501 family)
VALERRAAAQSGGASPLFVQIFLRGGADGLTLVCPYDDPTYQQKRIVTRVFPPGVGEPAKQAIHLANATAGAPAFGLPPALAPLWALYDEGKLAFVHACGSADPTRSHFDQQLKMEHAVVGEGGYDAKGWLGRHLSNPPGGSLRALVFAGNPADSFDGGSGVTPAPDPSAFTFPGDPATAAARQATLSGMYTLFGQPLAEALANDVGAIAKLDTVPFETYQPAAGAVYPANSVLGDQLKKTAAMAKTLADLEIVHIDFDNVNGHRWDTHADQGVFTGSMSYCMDHLARSLLAFLRDMENAREICVFVLTEFGRTLQENASLGTDHGRGSVAILVGDSVNGGQVVTDWTDLTGPGLDGGDQAVTIDIRHLMGEIAEDVLGTTWQTVIFDDTFPYASRNLIA